MADFLKTHAPQPIARQSAPTMDAATEARWNAWADARIKAALDARVWRETARSEAIGHVLGQMRAQLRKEFAEAVAALRADITIQRAHDNNTAGVVEMLPPFLSKRRRDAA